MADISTPDQLLAELQAQGITPEPLVDTASSLQQGSKAARASDNIEDLARQLDVEIGEAAPAPDPLSTLVLQPDGP